MGCHLGICGEPKVATTYSLAKALKTVRKARGLSQEAFSDVSSRTYMSTLERDLDLPPVDVPIRSGSPGSRLLDGYVG